MNIAVLMTCHNRRETTLRCLASLHEATKQAEVGGQGERLRLHVFLVDDGSTDGTGEAVSRWYEDQPSSMTSTFDLDLVAGNGDLYWAKGMALAWREALKHENDTHSSASTFNFDFFLWLNDDTVLNPDAISTLLRFHADNPNAVINGTLADKAGEPVYGLNVRNVGLAGNCVLVPRTVYDKVGIICDQYAHAWADRDYGLQVERAGFELVSAGVVGCAEWHELRPSLKGLTLKKRLSLLTDPKGWNVHDLWVLRCRNRNVFYALASCVHMIAHVIIGKHE